MMKIYDISQEVFGCAVYPSDPSPEREILSSIASGDSCNLTAFRMCAHNGTHIDAPYHFLPDGKTVDRLSLERTVGRAFVVCHEGIITALDAQNLLDLAKKSDKEAAKRLLLKGNVTVTEDAARVFADAGLLPRWSDGDQPRRTAS